MRVSSVGVQLGEEGCCRSFGPSSSWFVLGLGKEAQTLIYVLSPGTTSL